MAELTAFSRRLRSVRLAYAQAIDLPDLSASEFAELIGVPLASYEAFEAAVLEPPLSVLARLHRRTGVSLDWLIADPEMQETPTIRPTTPERAVLAPATVPAAI